VIAVITQTIVVRVDDEAGAEALADKMRDGTAMGMDLHLSMIEHEHPDTDVRAVAAEQIAVLGPTVQLIPEPLAS
jgi:hypothetical protein